MRLVPISFSYLNFSWEPNDSEIHCDWSPLVSVILVWAWDQKVHKSNMNGYYDYKRLGMQFSIIILCHDHNRLHSGYLIFNYHNIPMITKGLCSFQLTYFELGTKWLRNPMYLVPICFNYQILSWEPSDR